MNYEDLSASLLREGEELIRLKNDLRTMDRKEFLAKDKIKTLRLLIREKKKEIKKMIILRKNLYKYEEEKIK